MLGFLRVLVYTAEALNTNIEYKANNLWRLRQNSSSLHNIFMVEFSGGLIIMQLEYALDEAKVIVFKFKEARKHIDEVLFVLCLTLASFV
jgi:hypothetical protein